MSKDERDLIRSNNFKKTHFVSKGKKNLNRRVRALMSSQIQYNSKEPRIKHDLKVIYN
jgi:Holliday junction resolvase RusA-like endonuclease